MEFTQILQNTENNTEQDLSKWRNHISRSYFWKTTLSLSSSMLCFLTFHGDATLVQCKHLWGVSCPRSHPHIKTWCIMVVHSINQAVCNLYIVVVSFAASSGLRIPQSRAFWRAHCQANMCAIEWFHISPFPNAIHMNISSNIPWIKLPKLYKRM